MESFSLNTKVFSCPLTSNFCLVWMLLPLRCQETSMKQGKGITIERDSSCTSNWYLKARPKSGWKLRPII